MYSISISALYWLKYGHLNWLKQVGTLDTLVGLSDDLIKVDGFVEGVTRKISQYMGDVLEDQKVKITAVKASSFIVA